MPETMDENRQIKPKSTRRRHVSPGTAAAALVVGLATLTAEAVESSVVRDIQRYCTVCWRNARLDPGLWDDCTQEVCYRLLQEARAGRLDLSQVLADDTEERRELVRAIDMVRKRVQRARRFSPFDENVPAPFQSTRPRVDHQFELAELLDLARQKALTERQDRIVELWTHGWTVPDIARELNMTAARVSDEKYKALRRLERFLSNAEGEGREPETAASA